MSNIYTIQAKIFVLFASLIFFGIALKSQTNKTDQAIEKIRERYQLINNGKIENFRSETIDLINYTDTAEEGGTSGSIHTIDLNFNDKDTFYICENINNDEGGAYYKGTTEAYLWDNEPIFYYISTETMWEGVKEEYRIYIEKGKVIRKLHKSAVFFTHETGYKDVSIDDVPNETEKIDQRDYTTVIDFINSVKYLIESRKSED